MKPQNNDVALTCACLKLPGPRWGIYFDTPGRRFSPAATLQIWDN